MKLYKKYIVFLIVLVVLFMLEIKVFAATPTLEQIANSFNNCSTVRQAASTASTLNATVADNVLTISVSSDNTTIDFEYTLDGSILSTSINGDNTFIGLMVASILTDSIGQLHGYSDGDLFSTLNSNEIANYKIDTEGFEIKEISDGSYQVKIDISKKIPLIDLSNTYIEVSDLEDLAAFISGDGSAEKSKGNVWFYKYGYDNECILRIAENGSLSENAYKSILSGIQVIFDSEKAVNYFKTNYSGFTVGNKEFSGFKVEVNPTKTEIEENLVPTDSGYKFVRITIDKNLVKSAISSSGSSTNNGGSSSSNTSNTNNSSNKTDKTTSSGNIPQTGSTIVVPIIIISAITIALFLYKKNYNYKDIKN